MAKTVCQHGHTPSLLQEACNAMQAAQLIPPSVTMWDPFEHYGAVTRKRQGRATEPCSILVTPLAYANHYIAAFFVADQATVFYKDSYMHYCPTSRQEELQKFAAHCQEPEYDGFESTVGEESAVDPSFVQVTDKEVAMSPRIFCAECNAMTQWNATGHQQNTGARR